MTAGPHRHPVLQGQALQRLPRLDMVLHAPGANRRRRGANQAAVGAGAAGAQKAVSAAGQRLLLGHVLQPLIGVQTSPQTGERRL